jgi:hypothetical protein
MRSENQIQRIKAASDRNTMLRPAIVRKFPLKGIRFGPKYEMPGVHDTPIGRVEIFSRFGVGSPEIEKRYSHYVPLKMLMYS